MFTKLIDLDFFPQKIVYIDLIFLSIDSQILGTYTKCSESEQQHEKVDEIA